MESEKLMNEPLTMTLNITIKKIRFSTIARTIFAVIISIFTFQVSLLVVFAQADNRSSATWQVRKYGVTATLPQAETDRNLAVTASLDLKNVSANSASTLTLRISPTASVSSVSINGSVADFAKSEEKINASTSLQRIVIRIPSVAPGAAVNAAVVYKIAVKDNTGLASISATGTQFLPLSFWYPTPNCWFFTRGADVSAFKMKVVSGSAQIVSAGSETGGAFENKLNEQPFFATGNWDVTNASGVAVYAPKGAGADASQRGSELAVLFAEAKAFAAGYFGAAPDAPLRIVGTRRGAGFNSGGTVFVDEAVFRRPKIDSLTAMSIAETAAKLWIGGQIAVNGDGYGVIGEGLSRYIATEFIESKFGKDVADIERLRQRNAYASVSKRDAPMATISPLDDFYYPEVANKGAMMWRILSQRVGQAEFTNTLKANSADATLTVAELRSAFSGQKDLLDYFLNQVTDLNLLVGLPQTSGGLTSVAMRNSGSVDVTINVRATTASGQRLDAPTTIRSQTFGDVSFKTTEKIVRVEIDSEKLYPQTDFSDDIAPRETTDSDPLLAVKKAFDTKDFTTAEKTAKAILGQMPRFDEVRVLLARAELAAGKAADAGREFNAVLVEKLPTARSLAWASVGLAEVAAQSGQNDQAIKFAETAIRLDADYGASFAARALRNKLNVAATIDPAIKAYFTSFDRAAASNRKADLDALVVPGEVLKFASGISGSTEQWQTTIKQVDRIDANTVLVETNISIKLLAKEPESGLAVYRLSLVGGAWKLIAVDVFEVR